MECPLANSTLRYLHKTLHSLVEQFCPALAQAKRSEAAAKLAAEEAREQLAAKKARDDIVNEALLVMPNCEHVEDREC